MHTGNSERKNHHLLEMTFFCFVDLSTLKEKPPPPLLKNFIDFGLLCGYGNSERKSATTSHKWLETPRIPLPPAPPKCRFGVHFLAASNTQQFCYSPPHYKKWPVIFLFFFFAAKFGKVKLRVFHIFFFFRPHDLGGQGCHFGLVGKKAFCWKKSLTYWKSTFLRGRGGRNQDLLSLRHLATLSALFFSSLLCAFKISPLW